MTVIDFPKNPEPSPAVANLETITLALVNLNEEERIRPNLTGVLGKFPGLLAEYLTLSEEHKKALDGVCIITLTGGWYGDEMRQLDRYRTPHGRIASDTSRPPAMVARKCRWAYQLLEIFDSYTEGAPNRPFNQSYIKSAGGKTLVANIRNHQSISMQDIVNLVGQVRPAILKEYHPPGVKKAEVIRLRK